MDPSQMYAGPEHGTWFWVAFLTIAVLTTLGLMGALVAGISLAYRSPASAAPTSDPEEGATARRADAA